MPLHPFLVNIWRHKRNSRAFGPIKLQEASQQEVQTLQVFKRVTVTARSIACRRPAGSRSEHLWHLPLTSLAPLHAHQKKAASALFKRLVALKYPLCGGDAFTVARVLWQSWRTHARAGKGNRLFYFTEVEKISRTEPLHQLTIQWLAHQ